MGLEFQHGHRLCSAGLISCLKHVLFKDKMLPPELSDVGLYSAAWWTVVI